MSNVFTGLKRGLIGKCPNCGDGKLFSRYLKVDPVCDACEHDNAQYPADDAPPYFTILIVGHLVLGPLLIFPFIWQWPAQYVLLAILPALAILSLIVLPRVKGATVGLQWGIRRNNEARDAAR